MLTKKYMEEIDSTDLTYRYIIMSMYSMRCSVVTFKCFVGDSLHCPPLDRPFKSRILAHYPEKATGVPFDSNAVSMVSCQTEVQGFYTLRRHRAMHFFRARTVR